MTEALVGWILDEGKWMACAMVVAAAALAIVSVKRRRGEPWDRARITAAMGLFYGTVIGIMATGHLLAVTITVSRGALTASPWLVYPLGVALAVPAWWLVAESYSSRTSRRPIVILNTCLGLVLLALGLSNLPLAAPAALNVAYALHSRRAVGWALVGVTVAAYLALFVGSLLFLASGETFEQFMGIE